MSEFAGYLPRKFISFRHLGFESCAQNLLEKRKSEITQNVAKNDEVNAVVIGETSDSSAKITSNFQGAPRRTESIGARLGDEDRGLTMAEKDCVLTSSDDDVEDLSAFVTEKLQCMNEGSVKKFIRYGSVYAEEILWGSIGVGEDGDGKMESVCPTVALNGDVNADDRRFSLGEEINQILQEELGRANITSTQKRLHGPFTPENAVVC